MEWIKIDKSLPNDKEYVLVYGKGGRNVVAYYKDGKFLALDYWHDDFEECEELTHWMKLPKPPMKLISMTDYIFLMRENNAKDNIRRFWACEKYAQFLKQPLKLEMFVPCDEEGNIIDEKEIIEDTETFFRHGIAREKVLFKDIPMNEIDIQMLKVYESKNKTIEELFNETADLDFILTDNAIKQL